MTCSIYLGVCAQLCQTLCDPMAVACQAPLSVKFPRQEYWSGLPFPTAGDLLDPGIELASPVSPALASIFLPLHHLGSSFSYLNIFKH